MNTTNHTSPSGVELKPCPFCGCTTSPELKGNGIGDNWLECVECGASTRLREDGAGSAKDWNRRAAVSTSPISEDAANVAIGERDIAIPGATIKQVLDALRFYADGRNFQSVTFAQPQREEQLKRLNSDASWSEYMEDSRGHEQYREDGMLAQNALDAFMGHLSDSDNNYIGDAYDRMMNGEISLHSAALTAEKVAGQEPFPYQKTFDAIAAATSVSAGHTAISVTKFREAFTTAQQPAQSAEQDERPDIPENCDVRKILIRVAPGDGSGHEVYARDIADVEQLLSELGERLEDYELTRAASTQSTATQPVQAERVLTALAPDLGEDAFWTWWKRLPVQYQPGVKQGYLAGFNEGWEHGNAAAIAEISPNQGDGNG